MRIVFIGAGNVATHLSLALKNKGHDIVQVYSRTKGNAELLASNFGCSFTSDFGDIQPADLYIYALTDSALPTTINSMQSNTGIHVHTAGSVSATVFGNKFEKHGVFYPLQTFSKEKTVSFDTVPLFIEGSDSEVTETLMKLGREISNYCYEADSSKRMKMHISAVFACNFTNYFYLVAQQLIENEGIPFEILKPLIAETATKLNSLTPLEAQTGPARRNDQITIEKHLGEIEDEDLRQLYYEISKNITRQYNK